MSKSEEERARRLRDAQIRARDPGPSKIRHYDWGKHATRQQQIRNTRQKSLIADVFDVLPTRWKGLLVGVLFGFIPLVAARIWLTGEWVVLGVVGLLVMAILGFVIGAVLNRREPVR